MELHCRRYCLSSIRASSVDNFRYRRKRKSFHLFPPTTFLPLPTLMYTCALMTHYIVLAIRPVEREYERIEIDFLATSTQKGTFKLSDSCVTKLSFPNLWNYIRLWYFRDVPTTLCLACRIPLYVVCFIASDLVLRCIMLLYLKHYWKGCVDSNTRHGHSSNNSNNDL